MSGNQFDFDMEMDQEDGNQVLEESQQITDQNLGGRVPDNSALSSLFAPSSSQQQQGGLSGGAMLINPDDTYASPSYPSLPASDYSEWSYKMRRNMQEIIPGLFLGPYASATRNKLDDMKAAGLTHVVCVRQLLERHLIRPNHPDSFHYHVVEFADSLVDTIIPHFKDTNNFIESALNSGGKVLVHGNGGVSRSAALVIAYIMSRYGVTCKEAFSFVQQRRFCVNPNENFLAQLREYEPIYQAFHTVPLPLPLMESNAFRPQKRSLDLEDDNNSINDHESKARAVSNNY